MGSGAPLDRKWKFRLHYNIFALLPQHIQLNSFNFTVKGTLQLVCRLPPTDFFENWKRPRSSTPCPKILKKITRAGIDVLLQFTEFSHPRSNRSRDTRREIFGEFPNFLKICHANFPQNLIKCMGLVLQRNLGVWTILLEPFLRKIYVHILPPCSTVEILAYKIKSNAYKIKSKPIR